MYLGVIIHDKQTLVLIEQMCYIGYHITAHLVIFYVAARCVDKEFF